MEGITVDELRHHGLKVMQPRNGYRFSLDPLLLCSFASVVDGSCIADLGTGCGIIPLLLARKRQNLSITGIEFQEDMATLARQNTSLNLLDDTVSVLTEDIQNVKSHFPVSSFDVVVSNPPYRRSGTGKISPKCGRDKARHESTATLADFLSVAKFLVKPAGKIFFIYHTCRLVELVSLATAAKLAPLRLRMVHGNSQAEATMFLIELAKGRAGDLVIEPPLVVFDEDGNYNHEVLKILGQ